MCIRDSNNLFRFFQGGDTVQMRAAEAVGMLVGKDEKLVMGTLLYGCLLYTSTSKLPYLSLAKAICLPSGDHMGVHS